MKFLFYKNVAFLATTLQQSIQKCRVNQVMNLTTIQWIELILSWNVMVECWDCYSFLTICLYPKMSASNSHWYIKLCTNFYIYTYYFLNSEVEMVKQLTSVESEQKKTIADLEADILACHTKESELLAFSEKMTAKNAELQSTISGTLSKVFIRHFWSSCQFCCSHCWCFYCHYDFCGSVAGGNLVKLWWLLWAVRCFTLSEAVSLCRKGSLKTKWTIVVCFLVFVLYFLLCSLWSKKQPASSIITHVKVHVS